jgi:hypothetical protein
MWGCAGPEPCRPRVSWLSAVRAPAPPVSQSRPCRAPVATPLAAGALPDDTSPAPHSKATNPKVAKKKRPGNRCRRRAKIKFGPLINIRNSTEVTYPFSNGGFAACYRVLPSTTQRGILRNWDRRAAPAYLIIEAAPAYGIPAPAIADFDPHALDLLFGSADVTLVWNGGGADNAEDVVEAYVAHLRPGGLVPVVLARDHAVDDWLRLASAKSANPVYLVAPCALMRPGHLAVTPFKLDGGR